MTISVNINNCLAPKGLGDVTRLNSAGWNLLNEDVSFPVAVVYQERIENNLNWMQSFANASQVKLAPHGKTTMTPYFFQQQVNAGAWGITLATVPQVVTAATHGIERIIMANQLVGKYNCQLIAQMLNNYDVDFYCLVDSTANVAQLGKYFQSQGKQLQVLIEMGVPGGRCGCRNLVEVIQLKNEIAKFPALNLVGIEVYEGVIHGKNAQVHIEQFLSTVAKTTELLIEQDTFKDHDVILTGAGSAWYDLVASAFSRPDLNPRILPVIRPGCYLIHDEGIYQEAQDQVIQRGGPVCDIDGELVSSLEVWAYVQSIPEIGKAVIGMGKRDVAFDAGLPKPSLLYRPGTPEVKNADEDWQLTAIMDQHAFMSIPYGADIQVGDLVSFSTSHPCLTMDKWRNICIIDDQYNVRSVVSTYF